MPGLCFLGVRRLALSVRGAVRAGLLLLIALPAAQAATLSGSVYGATGISGLDVGGTFYDLTFHDAGGGSFADSFYPAAVTPAVTGISGGDEARTVLGAMQDFLRPLGPVFMGSGQGFAVMPFASDGDDFQYMTTSTTNPMFSRIYGAFSADIEDFRFHDSVAFVTAHLSPQAPVVRHEVLAARSVSMAPIPLPGTGLALLGALGLGAVALRRARTR